MRLTEYFNLLSISRQAQFFMLFCQGLIYNFFCAGVPWTEEEHRMFLLGLQKLGKGDWRGIARNYVISRTPTQVASHAQKYFIRQSNVSRRKRRSSLFDIVADEVCTLIYQNAYHEIDAAYFVHYFIGIY